MRKLPIMRAMRMNTGDRWFLSLLICSHLSVTIIEILLPFCYLFDRQTGRWNIAGADADAINQIRRCQNQVPGRRPWEASGLL